MSLLRPVPRVAGSVMRDQITVMREMFGEQTIDKAMASLAPSHQDELRNLLPIGWCSVEATNGLIAATATEIHVAKEKLQEDIARVGVERTFTTIWRVLLRLTTDKALVSRTPLMYAKTYDTGSLSSRIDIPGRADLWLDGWPDVPELELIALSVGVETVLRCAGRKQPRVTYRHADGGATFRATWKV